MRFAKCHPDRKYYAKDLCNACYSQMMRDIAKKISSDRDYEDRNRKERNDQRRILAAKRRAAAKPDSQSSEPAPD